MYTLLVFLVALGILIIVHEWGHYIVAKISGVWVKKFSLGFGPKIIGFKKNDTDYRIAPIPLGGFVELYGQDPWEEAAGDAAKADEIAKDPRSFHSKPFYKKLATVLAGPTMNLVLCSLLMPLVYLIGIDELKLQSEPPILQGVVPDSPAQKIGLKKGDLILSFNNIDVKEWGDLRIEILRLKPRKDVPIVFSRDGQMIQSQIEVIADENFKQQPGTIGIDPTSFEILPPIIGILSEDGIAKKAGLLLGDEIISVDGKSLSSFAALTRAIKDSNGQELHLKVLRNAGNFTVEIKPKFNEEAQNWLLGAENFTVKIKPEFNEEAQGWILGIGPQIEHVNRRYGLADAVKKGFHKMGGFFTLTKNVLAGFFTDETSLKSLGGPVQIAQATSMAAQQSFSAFLYLLALLSFQLGILNLLPIPVLDGGHVAFMVVEKIVGHPIAPKIRQVAMQTGMIMLLGLIVIVTYNDIDTVWGFNEIWGKIKNLF